MNPLLRPLNAVWKAAWRMTRRGGDRNVMQDPNMQLYLDLFRQGRMSKEAATRSATIYGAVRLVASAVAGLPLEVRNRKSENPDVPNDHPVERLWNIEPCPTFSGTAMREWVICHVLLSGNAYLFVEREVIGNGIKRLWPIDPSWVRPLRYNGRNVYLLSLGHGDTTASTYGAVPPEASRAAVDQESILHFHGLLYDGLIGKSIIETGAGIPASIDRAMSDHSGRVFDSGALSQYAITAKTRLDEKELDLMRESWKLHYARGTDSLGMPLILGGDSDVKPLTMNARELQMVESRDFQISEVLRAIGVPGILMNQENKSTSWGTGIQETKAGFLSFTLAEHVNRLESEINRKLFSYSQEYAMLKTDRLLRGTTKERYAAHKESLGGGQMPGWKSVNEIRREEGLSKVEGEVYDKPYMPAANPNPMGQMENETSEPEHIDA